MKKLLNLLTGILALQLLLAGGLFASSRHQASVNQRTQPLLSFQRDAIDRIEIEEGDLVSKLTRVDESWRLPGMDNLPASKGKVEDLLILLGELQAGWPVSTTASAHERFELEADKPKKRIKLYQGETMVAELLTGSSPGFRKTHVRAAGLDPVYSVALTAFDAPSEERSWLDTSLLQPKGFTKIKAPNYELVKESNSWTLAGESDKNKVDRNTIEKALKAFRQLTVVLPADEMPEGDPWVFEVTTADGVLTYSCLEVERKYYLRRSDIDTVFTLASPRLPQAARMTREDFLIKAVEASE